MCELLAKGMGIVHYTGCNNGGRKQRQSGRNVATTVPAWGALLSGVNSVYRVIVKGVSYADMNTDTTK